MNNEVSKNVQDVITFLKQRFPNGIQCFHTRNTMFDHMLTIYRKHGVIIDHCRDWNYIEVFGLNAKDYNAVVDIIGCEHMSDRMDEWEDDYED